MISKTRKAVGIGIGVAAALVFALCFFSPGLLFVAFMLALIAYRVLHPETAPTTPWWDDGFNDPSDIEVFGTIHDSLNPLD